MRLAALISGGKDSVYSAYLAGKEHEIVYAISMVSENPESYMFHFPNIHLVKEQAKLMNIPLIEKKTKGVKEEELDDIEEVLLSIKGGVDGLVTGALASTYQKMRIDGICKRLDLLSIAPLWHRDPAEYLRAALRDKFDVIIVGVAAPPIDASWLGRKLDEKMIDELVQLNLRHGIHPAGEGGELESLVLDCPMFSKKMEVLESEIVWDPKTYSGQLNVKKFRLVDKP